MKTNLKFKKKKIMKFLNLIKMRNKKLIAWMTLEK